MAHGTFNTIQHSWIIVCDHVCQEKSSEYIREYIIINDGSTVKSYERLQELAKENQIEKDIQIKNLGTRIGLIQARNLGAKFASGRVL